MAREGEHDPPESDGKFGVVRLCFGRTGGMRRLWFPLPLCAIALRDSRILL